MDEKEFLREKEKLKETAEKLELEEKVIEQNLSNTSSNYEKDSYVCHGGDSTDGMRRRRTERPVEF